MLSVWCPNVEICGDADHLECALDLLSRTSPDGLLLDISTKDEMVFDLLDKLAPATFQIIFLITEKRIPSRAFRYHPLDYLMKPITSRELIQSIKRIKKRPSRLSSPIRNYLPEENGKGKFKKIVIKSQTGMIFLDVNKMVRLESDGCYTTFHLLNGERHIVAQPMKNFESLLPFNTFYKIHQSHIINISQIKKVLCKEGSFLQMEDESIIPIARRRKGDFMEVLHQHFSF
jgi:two-component system LytT family response regulator